jgi:hypothetical protein
MRLFKILFCSFIIFISTLCFSAQLNPKEWVVFIKSYQNEQFCVNFPDDPEFFSRAQEKGEEKLFFANAASDGVSYSIEVVPTIGDDFLTNFFSSLKDQPNVEILNYSFFNQKKGLDIAYIDHDQFLAGKTRTIVTKKNTYILKTSYKVGEKKDHTYFTSSFAIIT